MAMPGSPEEWLKQAQYDFETAEYMFRGGRHFYAVFMAHLSLEKALKGLYLKTLNQLPPKVHSLVYLMNQIGVKPPEVLAKFMVRLNEASVATRYPEDIGRLQQDYTEPVAREIQNQAKEALAWISSQY